MDEEFWYWGATDKSFVDTRLNEEPNGSFLVFQDVDSDSNMFMLAYRQEDINHYKEIIFKDHYYGFTEPLEFESLSELLYTFNYSPITEDFLSNPLLRPQVEGEGGEDGIQLLLNIRAFEPMISEKSEERDEILQQVHEVEAESTKLQETVAGLTKISQVLVNQVERHMKFSQRVSSGQGRDAQKAISDNYERLLDRQCKVREEKAKKEAMATQVGKEKMSLLQKYTTCIFSMNSLQEQQADARRQFLSKFPYLSGFVACLLNDLSRKLPAPVVQDIRKGEAEKRLKGKSEGTFLVRVSRKDDTIPYALSVCSNEGVMHFAVYKIDGHYGCSETLCIFYSLEDLVNKYAMIPFSVHGEQFGDLNLTMEARVK